MSLFYTRFLFSSISYHVKINNRSRPFKNEVGVELLIAWWPLSVFLSFLSCLRSGDCMSSYRHTHTHTHTSWSQAGRQSSPVRESMRVCVCMCTLIHTHAPTDCPCVEAWSLIVNLNVSSFSQSHASIHAHCHRAFRRTLSWTANDFTFRNVGI